MTKRIPAVRGTVYTFRDICERLDLRDSPSLDFRLPEECWPTLVTQVAETWQASCPCSPVQTAHVTEEEILAIPGWAESEWVYRFETSEWIPVFYFRGGPTPIGELLDYEPLIDPHAVRAGRWWAVPKGKPRKQHYRIVNGLIVDQWGDYTYPMPLFDENGDRIEV